MSRHARTWLLLLLAAGCAAGQDWAAKLQQGSALLRQRQYDAASAIFEEVRDQAVRDHTELAEAGARLGLGNIQAARAEYAAALPNFERAAELYDRNPGPVANRWRLSAYREIAAMAYYLGDRAKSLEAARKRLELARASGSTAVGQALYSLAFLAPTPEQSLDYLRQGLATATAAGDAPTEGMLYHLWSDHLWVAGHYRESQQKLTTALALLDRPGLESERARALTSQGRLHRTYSRYGEALAAYSEALQIQERLGDLAGIRQSLEAMALALDRLGRTTEAAAQLQRALAVARSIGSPMQVSSVLEEIGAHLASLGEFDRAIPQFEESARLNPANALSWTGLAFSYLKAGRAEDALRATNRALELPAAAASTRDSALLERAGALHRLGRDSDAERDVQAAVARMEEERRHLRQDDDSRIGFADEHTWFYRTAIPVLAEIAPVEALAVAEQARARAFLDLLATREVQGREGSGDLQGQVRAEPYRADQIAAAARRLGSTVILYWLDENEVLIWVVNGDGEVHLQRVPVSRKEIASLVAGVGDAQHSPALLLAAGDSSNPTVDTAQREPWDRLYRYLIQPIEQYLPPAAGSLLTIVPHGPLFRLPFAALRDRRGRYLIERYAFHYAPAAAVLGYAGRPATEGIPANVVVANPANMPDGPDGKALPPLPEAGREARAIARILPETQVLEGAEATSAAVSGGVRNRSVIHLATHGVLLENQPLDSFLALSGGELKVRDIYRWDLSADLVVLSACRSGVGRMSADGMIGITRAFLYAGAASVMATLWDVTDAPTLRLMAAFYRHYRRSKDKALALRAAQLELLQALRSGEITVKTAAGVFVLPETPLFWAPFILSGQP